MKVLVALAVLLTAPTVFSSERSVFDVMYFPKAGTFYGITDANLIRADYEATGVDSEITGYILEQTIGFSLTDRLTFFGELDYANLDFDTKFPGSGQPSQESSTDGLSDPTLKAKYRLLDENLLLDLIGSWTIKSEDRRVNEDGDANYKEGGHIGALGAQIGQKNGGFQWTFSGEFRRNFEAHSAQAADSYNDEEHNEWAFQGAVQMAVMEKSFIKFDAGVRFTDEFEDDTTPVAKVASQTDYLLRLEFRHMVTENFLARVGLQEIIHKSDTGFVDESKTMSLNLGATYQF